MKSGSFRFRLLAPTLTLCIAVTLVAAIAGSWQVVGQLSARFEAQAARTVEFVAKVGTPYVINYDLTALGTFVKELARDDQVVFAEFFDAEGRSLTEDVATSPDSAAGLLLVEREITDAAGKSLGKLRAGFRRDAVTAARQAVLVAIGGALLAVLAVVVVMLLWSARQVMRVLGGEPRDAVDVADRIAGGDLTHEVPVAAGDRASLMAALARMQAQLRRIVGDIRESAASIGTASSEVSAGNQDLTQRTEEQAGSLEQTSASMQQMRSTVGQNAQNAGTASALAGEASGIAVKGGGVVRAAVETMNAVTASSRKISEIIGVIDGIAFQTNILALNAAVEAARAGEQGRGFAVVAAEVRSLAHRSASAAKEIKDLISDSVAKVDIGARQVNDAGSTMEEIVAAVTKVSRLVSEISSASQEQAQGIEQVSESVTQMEKVTQQNAAMVEQASAAANSMADQSRALIDAVAVFRLREQAPGALRAAEPAPARATGPGAARKMLEAQRAAREPAAAANAPRLRHGGQLQEVWQEI
jgi:methyl-accepting chemotaxis protein